VIAETPYFFSIAALSVSLAGFAGLIAAFRRGTEWRPMDLFRVREIVEFGFANAILALLTVPLMETVHDVSRMASIGCALAAAYLFVTSILLLRRREHLDLPRTLAWYAPATLVTGSAFILAVAGAVTGEPALLLWTLLVMLGRPMLAFVLVLALLRNDAA
jgi:hypothetical protein